MERARTLPKKKGSDHIMWFIGGIVGAGVGYLVQPTVFSTVEGAVVGIVAGLIIGMVFVGAIFNQASRNW